LGPKTVLSHCFEELRRWANKFLILQKGKPVFCGTVKDLEDLYPFFIRFPRPVGGLEGLPEVRTVKVGAGTLQCAKTPS
ncbi:MAG: hypothetical protein IIY26_03170, partial [Aeriscardovia sp.]|nr:hypothetical protein [Aeriscardovia sp.]